MAKLFAEPTPIKVKELKTDSEGYLDVVPDSAQLLAVKVSKNMSLRATVSEFESEVALVSSLIHPNILTFYGV